MIAITLNFKSIEAARQALLDIPASDLVNGPAPEAEVVSPKRRQPQRLPRLQLPPLLQRSPLRPRRRPPLRAHRPPRALPLQVVQVRETLLRDLPHRKPPLPRLPPRARPRHQSNIQCFKRRCSPWLARTVKPLRPSPPASASRRSRNWRPPSGPTPWSLSTPSWQNLKAPDHGQEHCRPPA